jgi:mRNA interferase MazF
MTSFSKYDIVVVKFPFASSLKYKARPAVVISSDLYNENSRGTLLILAISNSIENKLDFELEIQDWRESGLLKPSVFKSAVATIEKDFVLSKLGSLSETDIKRLGEQIEAIC